jgi:hypothetical protein
LADRNAGTLPARSDQHRRAGAARVGIAQHYAAPRHE